MGGFLGGLLSTAEGLSTPLNQVMGARATAQVQANKEKIASALQQAQLQRQMQDDAIKQQLMQAQARNYNSESNARDHPKANILRGPGGQLEDVTDPSNPKPIGPAPTSKPLAPYPIVQAQEGIFERRPDGIYDVATGEKYSGKTLHPVSTQPTFTPVTTGGTDGTPPQIHPFNTKTGQAGPSIGDKPATGSGSVGQLSPQALAGMEQQAADADKIMRDFEARYEKNPKIVGTGSGIAGAAANSDGKGLLSGLTRVAGNFALSKTDPDYQRYVAAQKRFGNIMGNLMSRRYTEYQGILDTDLSGLAPGDLTNTLGLKQTYRQDLLSHFPAATASTAATHRAAPSAPAPKPSAAKKPKSNRDYGIFGSGGGDDE